LIGAFRHRFQRALIERKAIPSESSADGVG
jgi:hypothetical protein